MLVVRLMCLMYIGGIAGEDRISSRYDDIHAWVFAQSDVYRSYGPPPDSLFLRVPVEQVFRVMHPDACPVRSTPVIVPFQGITLPHQSSQQMIPYRYRRCIAQDWVPPPV